MIMIMIMIMSNRQLKPEKLTISALCYLYRFFSKFCHVIFINLKVDLMCSYTMMLCLFSCRWRWSCATFSDWHSPYLYAYTAVQTAYYA